MPTLIAVYNSDGVIVGRCDGRCYDAVRPGCECCCCGINHGVGLRIARANIKKMKWTGDKDRKIVKECQVTL